MGQKSKEGRFDGWTKQQLFGADRVIRLLATSVRIRGAALQLLEQIHNEICDEYENLSKVEARKKAEARKKKA